MTISKSELLTLACPVKLVFPASGNLQRLASASEKQFNFFETYNS